MAGPLVPIIIGAGVVARALAARGGATAAARGAARGGSATGRAAAGARGASTARGAASKARGAAAKKTAAKKAIKKKGAEGPKKKKTVTGWHGEEISRTKSAQKRNAQMKKDEKQVGKKYQKKGSINGLSLRSPSVTAKGFRGMGPVASRQTKPPIKYGKR